MSEFYIKSIEPGELIKENEKAPERLIRVNISSFKGRSNVELIAEHDGAVIGETRFNLNIRENMIDIFIRESAGPRKIIFKLFYKGFNAGYYEADI